MASVRRWAPFSLGSRLQPFFRVDLLRVSLVAGILRGSHQQEVVSNEALDEERLEIEALWGCRERSAEDPTVHEDVHHHGMHVRELANRATEEEHVEDLKPGNIWGVHRACEEIKDTRGGAAWHHNCTNPAKSEH